MLTNDELDFRLLFESSPDLYLILNANLEIVAVSDAYTRATLTRREEILGKTMFQIFPDNPDDPTAEGQRNLRASLQRVLQSGKPDTMPVQKYDIPRPDGEGFEERYWSPMHTPILGKDGKVAYIIHRAEDLTDYIRIKQQGVEQSQLNETLRAQALKMEIELFARSKEIASASAELKAANEKLSRLYAKTLELDELKSQFFANVSHELRTPLTLIMAPLERRLAFSDSSESERRETEMMLRNARLLYRHVTDLLDIAKFDAGQMKMHWAKIDLAYIVRLIGSHFESLGRDKQIDFRIHVPKLLLMEGDREKLERVLINLFSNAFKFTQSRGRIEIRLSIHHDQVVLEVQDNGPGVQLEFREAVFQRFRQVEGGSQRQYGGTGLGLAIVNDFVQLHGGVISLCEAPGGGALFTVKLPLSAPPGSILSKAVDTDTILHSQLIEEISTQPTQLNPIIPDAGESAPLVLVVEDNPDMNRYICDILRPNYRIAQAYNGRAGLYKARELSPDLIISDIMMPIMDGSELVAALHSDPTTADIPIILLTAKADDTLRVELLQTGVQDYLQKPFNNQELLARVNEQVTSYRRNAEQLRNSDIRFEATFEQAAVGMALVAPNGRFLRVNRKLCEFLGYSAEELQSLTFQEITCPDDLDNNLRSVQGLLVGEYQQFITEKRYIRKNGSLAWANLSMALVRKTDGTSDYRLAVIEDIQTRKDLEFSLEARNRTLGATQTELAASEKKFRSIFEDSNDAIISQDLKGIITSWNPSAEVIFGYTDQEALGHPIRMLYPQDREQDEEALMERVLKEERISHYATERIHKEGKRIFVSVTISPIHDTTGQIIGASKIARDITEQMQAETKLRESANRYRSLLDNLPQAVWQKDANSTYITCNAAYSTSLGISPEQIIGKTDFDFFGNELAEKYRADDLRVMEAGETEVIDETSEIGGELKITHTTKTPLRNDEGEIIGTLGIAEDLTERKAVEQKFQENLNQLNLLGKALEAASNAVMITDSNGTLEWINPAFTNLTGYSLQEAVGNHPRQLLKSGKEPLGVYEKLWSRITQGHTWLGEITNRRKDGSIYYEEQTITPVTDEQGRIRHYIAIKQDVTDRMIKDIELQNYREHLEELVSERTQELEFARKQAEHAAEIKSIFLANMSHELRTPMNAMLGYCYLLQKRQLAEESRQLVSKIHTAGHSLLAIINDILDVSKIEAGHLELESAPFRLDELIGELSDIISEMARSKNLELVITPPVGVNGLIGDALRLKQILLNLLNNALKFTEQGEVELSIKIDEQDQHQVVLDFTVRDTGIGISDAQLQTIFAPFTQADVTISRRFGGTGLGLAICRQLIELMGGMLQVKSEINKGSEFAFRLRLLRSETVGLFQNTQRHLKLLIADDSVASRQALLNILTNFGWTADCTDSGESALNYVVTAMDRGHPYDLILLDWNMPGMDGLATADAILVTRQKIAPLPNKQPIIMMVTEYSKQELLKQAGIERVDDVLSKPITPSSFYGAVVKAIQRRTLINADRPAKLEKGDERRIQGIRILVVDDSEINREVAKGILAADGAVVILANNGLEAVNWLQQHPDEVDIVLMDVQMPVMDGYTAARIIRQDQRWQALPIIALTAGAFQSQRESAFNAGMDDFVAKPFNVEQLMSTIQRITGSSIQSLSDLNDSRMAAHQPPPLAVAEESHVKPLAGIDFNRGVKQWGQETAYRTYLKKFVDAHESAAKTIGQFIAEDNFDAASALAHKLKGVAANLALPSVMAEAGRLESQLSAQLCNEESIAALQAALDEACLSIRQWDTQPGEVLPSSDPTINPDMQVDLPLLLTQLQAALQMNNPDYAAPILGKLKGILSGIDHQRITACLADYDFPGANQLVATWLNKLK